jgi:branched-chain amino acid transport system permease protein
VAIEPTIVSAAVFGSLAALASVGLTLTYLTTKVPNFAHGAFVTIGAYVGVYSVQLLQQSPYSYSWLAFILGGLVALAQYKLVLKPLSVRGTSVVGLMVATITFDIFLFGVISIVADWANRTFKVQTSYVLLRLADFAFLDIPGVMIASLGLLVGISISLYLLLNKTRLGTAMRAAIENPSLAGVVGVNVDAMYSLAWFLSGGFGGLAGLLFGLWFPVTTTAGGDFLPTIFASSILGGLGSVFGALVGGLLVGASIVYIPLAIANLGFVGIIQFRPIIPLVIMAVVLLTLPSGLMSLSIKNLIHRRWRLW